MSDRMSNMPGASAMNDTLEFVRNFWGAMKIPGMAMPSMSPDDINKQIADLKAVESWLQMNMNMLRSTIQTLEVQSATLSALQSMSESFAKAAKGSHGGNGDGANDGQPAFESPFQAPFESRFESPFTKPAGKPEATATPDPAEFAAQFANPAAWWNTVQDQFTKAVGSAMATPDKPARTRSASAAKKGSAGSGKRTGTAKSAKKSTKS